MGVTFMSHYYLLQITPCHVPRPSFRYHPCSFASPRSPNSLYSDSSSLNWSPYSRHSITSPVNGYSFNTISPLNIKRIAISLVIIGSCSRIHSRFAGYSQGILYFKGKRLRPLSGFVSLHHDSPRGAIHFTYYSTFL